MIKTFSYSFFVLLFLLLNNQLYSVNYLIDGYVVIDNLYLPVENQIVEIRNADGEIIASALTDEAGYYSKEIDLPVSAGMITLSLSRICSGEVNYYNHTLQLENVHLGYTFLVCEDQICEAGFNYEQQSRNSLVIEFTNISEGDIDSYF